MKKLLLLLCLVPYTTICLGQGLTQTIRGQVLETETQQGLFGVTVLLEPDSLSQFSTASDEDGRFRIENVPIGNYSLIFTYPGYVEVFLNKIEVSSAKEVILNVNMEELPLEIEGVEIQASRDGESSNEMAQVSARQFSVEESNRYAGSRGDPARMASNFAGVQGSDDSRNDIVIRGNTPLGVLWRIEGVNIPNPNHFSIAGTSGGPVSILNNKFLANSDFYTGAFPSEFGNSISGVFDLKLRNGNDENHEFSAQIGFLGTELFAEGPLNKEKGHSYIVGGRYSTFALFEFMNIRLGTDAVPSYQDGQFRFNFRKASGGNMAFWGLGGMSDIGILISDQKEVKDNIFGEDDRDQYFSTDMAALGLSSTDPIGKSAFLKTSIGFSHSMVSARHFFVHRYIDSIKEEFVVDSLAQLLDYRFLERKLSLSSQLNQKLNRRNAINYGINFDLSFLNYQDSFRNVTRPSQAHYYRWVPRWASKDQRLLGQGHVSWKHKFNDRLSMVTGVHGQFDPNNFALEPRVGLTFDDTKSNRWSFGSGLHSQHIPSYLFYYSQNYDSISGELGEAQNQDLDFMQSWHLVMGYERMLSSHLRFKTELYFQSLYNVPVDVKQSAFSILNSGSGFSRIFPDSLVNAGVGQNLGVDFTLEKYFDRNFLWMVTASIFDSKYRGSDGVWRPTDYATNYSLNALVSKEFPLKKGNSLGMGLKGTWIGGKRYGIIDTMASQQNEELIYKSEKLNTFRLDDYIRADLKINYKVNQKRVSHEFALDIANVIDRVNPLGFSYSPNPETGELVKLEEQLRLLPIFYYKIDF